MLSYRYIILGGGVAAGYAAKQMVNNGLEAGDLAILSAEKRVPYHRPPLSKDFLAGEKSAVETLIQPQDFYPEHGIDVFLDTVIEKVDLESKKLFSAGETYQYDKLLITTGSRLRRFDLPGAELDGIYYLRRIEDAQEIRRAYANARQAVVIGGSFIGMEVASVLQQQGLDTTMVFIEERVWEPVFTPPMSEYFETYYRQRGVKILPGSQVESFVGQQGQVTRVRLSTGRELPADIVVAGIGVQPNTGLFKDSPLKIDDGILVNRFLETNMPDVFAAGDVARYHSLIYDRPLRTEHWDNAVQQGKHAGLGLLGKRLRFSYVPYFFSDVFDLSYEYWGDNRGASEVIYRGDVDAGSFSVWWLNGDWLVAGFALNTEDDIREIIPDLIESGQAIDKEVLANNKLSINLMLDEPVGS